MLTIKLKKDARVGRRDFSLTTRSLPPQIFWTCRPSHLRQVVDLLQCGVRCPHGLVDWDVKLLPGGMWCPRTSHCGAQLTVHTCLADWRSFLRGACASQSHHAAPAPRYSQQFQQAPFQNLWTRVELPKVSQQTHTRHPALPAQECADRQMCKVEFHTLRKLLGLVYYLDWIMIFISMSKMVLQLFVALYYRVMVNP